MDLRVFVQYTEETRESIMTVAELFAQLQAAIAAGQGQLEVVVRAVDDEGSDYCGTIGQAAVETNKEGSTFFAIDCGPEESDDWQGDEDELGEGEAGEEELDESDEADEEETDEGEEPPH
jgi:hypothetical protein